MARKLLVVGASGQVGRACLAAFGAARWETVGTAHRSPAPGLLPLDLADEAALRAAVRSVRPQACILAAALTHVDRCEDEPALAHMLNARAPGVLAEACREVGAAVAYLSTEYVFDGRSGPYGEADPPSPISVYGRSKLEGEQAVQAAAPGAVVARTTVVYSHDPPGKNFAMQLLARLGQGERMKVPRDQISSPTYAPDLALALRLLLEQGFAGVVNVVGPEVLDRYAFALAAAKALGLDPGLLDPVDTASLGQKAARPLRAGLLIGKLTSLVGPVMRKPAQALADLAEAARRAAGAPRP